MINSVGIQVSPLQLQTKFSTLFTSNRHNRALAMQLLISVHILLKERQEEVDMVCAVVDRSNPWRAVSMRQRKRPLEQVGKVRGIWGGIEGSSVRC